MTTRARSCARTSSWSKDAPIVRLGAPLLLQTEIDLDLDVLADPARVVPAFTNIVIEKAFRTNPLEFAMDKTHRYANTQPEGDANRYETPDGRETWIARPQGYGR